MILTFDDAVEAIDAGVTDWRQLTKRLPRNDLPAVLTFVWVDLDESVELPAAVADAWQSAEHPERFVDRDEWLDWLLHTGYLVNGRPAPRPTEPIVLYRGGTLPDRMAWTADREIAEWFRDRFPGGRLWSCIAPPEALMMQFDGTTGRVGETEYVVDPALITGAIEL